MARQTNGDSVKNKTKVTAAYFSLIGLLLLSIPTVHHVTLEGYSMHPNNPAAARQERELRLTPVTTTIALTITTMLAILTAATL